MLGRLGGGLGIVGLAAALADLDADDRAALGAPSDGVAGRRVGTHAKPRAKRIIQLFMNGGPFGPDVFDPKPALARYAGQRPKEVELRTERATAGILPSPFAFARHGESGLEVSELLPRLARHADELCVLRSLHCDNPNHGPALLQMNNGTITPKRPSLGAWLSYGLGNENRNLPSYVVLCPGRPVRFSVLWNSAFLPPEYQGTYVNHSRSEPDAMIPFLKNPGGNPASQRRQLDLVRELNLEQLETTGPDARLEARIAALETAYRMQFSASEAFDVALESEATREAYGRSHFSNGCLLARRLVERGVRFVQVYYGNGQPWDTHAKHSERVRALGADIDRPIAALLADLRQRGLLDDTLVVWCGEFGRTPTTDLSEGNGDGRDHNHYGFTGWLAGGGVRGGMAYGATDPFGFRAVEHPVHIHDFHATILHLMGLDHERLTYRSAGRDFRLTDEFGRVLRDIVA